MKKEYYYELSDTEVRKKSRNDLIFFFRLCNSWDIKEDRFVSHIKCPTFGRNNSSILAEKNLKKIPKLHQPFPFPTLYDTLSRCFHTLRIYFLNPLPLLCPVLTIYPFPELHRLLACKKKNNPVLANFMNNSRVITLDRSRYENGQIR